MDSFAVRRAAGTAETVSANRHWWDAEAQDYYAEHGAFLGDADFCWGPEGLRAVSYTHLRAHETVLDLVCRLLLEKKTTINYVLNFSSYS